MLLTLNELHLEFIEQKLTTCAKVLFLQILPHNDVTSFSAACSTFSQQIHEDANFDVTNQHDCMCQAVDQMISSPAHAHMSSLHKHVGLPTADYASHLPPVGLAEGACDATLWLLTIYMYTFI